MQTRKMSILCPNCRKLISSDEQICPYCHISRPGSAFKNNPFISKMADGRTLAMAIIWLNVGMYVLSVIFSSVKTGFIVNPENLISPSKGLRLLGETGTIPIDAYGMWWTLLSANYLHAGPLHILFNMIMFWQLVPAVSREYGSYRMFSIYTLGGVIGFIVSYLAGITYTVGASAAVCSLVGSLLYYGKSRGGHYGQMIYKQVSGWVISLFLFGLIVPGINNWAHGGGILGGIIVGWIMGYGDKVRENVFHKSVAFICAMATVLVLLWSVIVAFI